MAGFAILALERVTSVCLRMPLEDTHSRSSLLCGGVPLPETALGLLTPTQVKAEGLSTFRPVTRFFARRPECDAGHGAQVGAAGVRWRT
jgi:hypothetical protein